MAEYELSGLEYLETIIPHYEAVAKLIEVARTTIGYRGRPISDGSCVPISLLLAGILDPNQFKLEHLRKIQHELLTYLDNPQHKQTKSPFADAGTLFNYSYQLMAAKESLGSIVQTALLIESEDSLSKQINDGNTLLQVGLLMTKTAASGRPETHSILVRPMSSDSNRVLLLSDFGLEMATIVTSDANASCGSGIIPGSLDQHRLVAQISITNLFRAVESTQDSLGKYYSKQYSACNKIELKRD